MQRMRAHIALAVVEDLYRVGQPVELDAFLLGVMDFFGARRAFGARAAIDAIDFLGAQPQADPHRIHRRVAGADHRDAAAERNRRVEFREFLARIRLQRVSSSLAESTPLSELPGMPSIDG